MKPLPQATLKPQNKVIEAKKAKRCCKQFAKFNRTNTNVFVSGDLSVEDFDTSILPRDPYQFKFIDATPINIKLEAAPLKAVIKSS